MKKLLVFLQTGLQGSLSRRWVAIVKSWYILALCLFVSVWLAMVAPLLIGLPLLVYFGFYLFLLVMPESEGTLVFNDKVYSYAVYTKKRVFRHGCWRFADGLFVLIKDDEAVNIIPISGYSKRLVLVWSLLIKPASGDSWTLYSQNYPQGLKLGEAIGEMEILFCDKAEQKLWIVNPLGVYSIPCSGKAVAGETMESDDWDKALYIRVADGKEVKFSGLNMCRVPEDEVHLGVCFVPANFPYTDIAFWRVENPDESWTVIRTLFCEDGIVHVLTVHNVPEILFEDEDGTKVLLKYDAKRDAYRLAEVPTAAEKAQA